MNAPSRQVCLYACTVDFDMYMYRIGRATKKKLGNSNQQNEIKETSDERNVEGVTKRDLWSGK
eukprot:scaffold32025_cov73-Skeletonema_marinoi.AAC.1